MHLDNYAPIENIKLLTFSLKQSLSIIHLIILSKAYAIDLSYSGFRFSKAENDNYESTIFNTFPCDFIIQSHVAHDRKHISLKKIFPEKTLFFRACCILQCNVSIRSTKRRMPSSTLHCEGRRRRYRWRYRRR